MGKMSIRPGTEIIMTDRKQIAGKLRDPGDIVIVGSGDDQVSPALAEELVTIGAGRFGAEGPKPVAADDGPTFVPAAPTEE